MIPTEYVARKLPWEFDGARLVADLDRVLEDEWVPHPYTEQGGVLFKGKEYYVAAVLTDNGAIRNVMPHLPVKQETRENAVLPTPLLERSPYIREVLGRFDCDFNMARLLAMDPGIVVKKHIDKIRLTHYQFARFHVPIVTNPKAWIYVYGRWIQPRVGECWYLDAAVPHAVRNDGAARRVHLVIDCLINDFVNELVGFDLTEFRRSHAEEYRRLWNQFERQWNRRKSLHEWNMRIQRATHHAVDGPRRIADRVFKRTPPD